jgi:hypothetical protein
LLLIVLCIIIQLGWKAKKDLFIAKGSSTPWLVSSRFTSP